jgi:hypothetical protein
MIVVLEPLTIGIQHAPVNAGMIEIARHAFPDTRIAFYAERAHLAEVKTLIEPALGRDIEWQPIQIPDRDTGFSRRFTIELRLLRQLMALAQRGNGHLLLLSGLESSLYAAKLVQAMQSHPVPVQALLHGYLNRIIGWRSRNPLARALDLRSALCRCGGGALQYVVLEEGIARKLHELLPDIDGTVQWLSHPVPPGEGETASATLALPIRIGFLGLSTVQKGFDVFLAAAQASAQARCQRVEFHAIGRLAPETPTDGFSALKSVPQAQGLSRRGYVDAVRRMHYVCLPYQAAYYELSASGVLLDAIAWGKPIIALPSPTVRSLFAAHPGIGYLCANADEMLALIERLGRQCDMEAYRRQVKAMHALRREREPRFLSVRYREITRQVARVSPDRAAAAAAAV